MPPERSADPLLDRGAIHRSVWTGGTWARYGRRAGGYADTDNLIVWVNDNGGRGTLRRSRHDLFFAFSVGGPPHTNSVELGQYGAKRKNVWQYHAFDILKAGPADEKALHRPGHKVEYG